MLQPHGMKKVNNPLRGVMSHIPKENFLVVFNGLILPPNRYHMAGKHIVVETGIVQMGDYFDIINLITKQRSYGSPKPLQQMFVAP